jgi:preprotein translocase subunit SecB
MGTLQLEKIYLRQCVVNILQEAEAFTSNKEPKIDFQIAVNHHALAEKDKHEVLLTLAAEYKQEDKVLAKVQLHQAGIFTAKEYAPEQLEFILRGYCPNMLYPHLQARAMELTQQAGLKPFMLQPMDFTQVYKQVKQQEEAKKATQQKEKAEAGEESELPLTSPKTSPAVSLH